MLGRLSKVEAAARSALPGYESESLWTIGGRRRLNPRSTLVLDLQTGEGAAFGLLSACRRRRCLRRQREQEDFVHARDVVHRQLLAELFGEILAVGEIQEVHLEKLRLLNAESARESAVHPGEPAVEVRERDAER